MLHEQEKSNVQQTLERTRAAVGVLMGIEDELRVIRKGMAPGPEKHRLGEMIRLNREAVAGLERKLTLLERYTPETSEC